MADCTVCQYPFVRIIFMRCCYWRDSRHPCIHNAS